MNVLILGSGGREHALTCACSRSALRPRLFCMPGNPGMRALAECLVGDPCDEDAVFAAVAEKRIDLVIVGPEAPLVAGVADALRAKSIRVFGPNRAAAALEGSKVFAKDFMRRHSVPTALFAVVADVAEARRMAGRIPYPHVLKADGLAAGKGALVVESETDALAAIDLMLVQRAFGDAGGRIVFEEYLTGEEVSFFAVAAGREYRLLLPSQDYKRVAEDDQGPNTGGMGAIAPVPIWTKNLETRVCRDIIEPTLAGMVAEERSYSGLLYVGLMVTNERAAVIEFNCRFGDPETQALVPVLSPNLLELLWAASAEENEALPQVTHDGRSGACVVIASAGYPGAITKGHVISGLERAGGRADTVVFHAGTAMRDGRVVTNGGRVLNVVGVGTDLPAALETAYRAAEDIEFEGSFFRRDIGWRGLKAVGVEGRGRWPR